MMGRRRLYLAVAVALAVVIGAAAVIVTGGSATHLDGQGDLANTGDPGGEEMFAGPSPSGSLDFSFALQLCAWRETAGPIVLDKIEPVATVGGGVELLGTLANTWITQPPPSGFISWDAYPPPPDIAAYPLFDFSGAQVTNRCDSDANFEAIVGLRLVDPAKSGGWDGVRVTYHVRDRRSVLLLPRTRWILCADAETCGGLGIPIPGASP